MELRLSNSFFKFPNAIFSVFQHKLSFVITIFKLQFVCALLFLSLMVSKLIIDSL